MFDVLPGIAVLVAIIWWLGRDTSPSGPPRQKSPPAPPRSTSSGTAPRAGAPARPLESTRGDDAFVDGLIIGAYYYGHRGRDADDGSADPLPRLRDDELGGDLDDPLGFDDDFDF